MKMNTQKDFRYYSVHNLISKNKTMDNEAADRWNTFKEMVNGNVAHKYQRIKEVHNVIGFIVNIHDAINFDIDLDLPEGCEDKYLDVISNRYTYQDLNPDVHTLPNIVPNIGKTYRCRLRGISINHLSQQIRNQKSNQMCAEVKCLIDRADCWVSCTLSDVDIYHRLLVDIDIDIFGKVINLKDHLLSKMEGDENSIFCPYSTKNRYKDPNTCK